jgi:hypothetical protein
MSDEPDDDFNADGDDDAVRVKSDRHHLLLEFRDLAVVGVNTRRDDFVAEVERRLVPPWTRAAQFDKADLAPGVQWRVFERLGEESLPGALLFLWQNDRGDLTVSNIVPTEGHSLGRHNYNKIASEFFELYAHPSAEALGLRSTLSNDWVDIADELGETLFGALVTAALFKPGTHPSDQERWMRFIVGAFRRGTDVNLEHLQRWLDADGFGSERAYEMMLEFDFGLQLLQFEREQQ